ncbi:MAG: pentapeptide repeat-containing protein [Gammaproteobacteria bacterium]|nr:pentapeptide repeat-containing protein [Gammaproteobacteria bacterium]
MGHTEQHKGRWYVKQGDIIRGPFPNQLISSYLILGRLELDTEISQDKEHWAPISEYKALVPDVVLNAHTTEGAKALMLARLREDERSSHAGEFEDTELERRDHEDQVVKLHRQLRDDVIQRYRARPRASLLKLVLIVGVSLLVLIAIIIFRPAEQYEKIDCSSAPQQGVNWTHCNKQGENLSGLDLRGSRFENTRMSNVDLSRTRLDGSNFSYADLSQSLLQQASLVDARMVGVIMRQANLQNANLTNADLSYAELKGANLTDALLTGARLDHAIWLNGETCQVGSLGACLLPSK